MLLTRAGSAYFSAPYFSANLLHATAHTELEQKTASRKDARAQRASPSVLCDFAWYMRFDRRALTIQFGQMIKRGLRPAGSVIAAR